MWIHSASPSVVEALGDTGYDCLILDCEHGPSSLEQVRAQFQASYPYDCGVCVRAPWNDHVYPRISQMASPILDEHRRF
ncbi:MAG: aldolase/citrate lyase family protein [Tagaea sp.]